MKNKERALTTSEYGVALPFTTELVNKLANEFNSRVTGELLLVFVHGIGGVHSTPESPVCER